MIWVGVGAPGFLTESPLTALCAAMAVDFLYALPDRSEAAALREDQFKDLPGERWPRGAAEPGTQRRARAVLSQGGELQTAIVPSEPSLDSVNQRVLQPSFGCIPRTLTSRRAIKVLNELFVLHSTFSQLRIRPSEKKKHW